MFGCIRGKWNCIKLLLTELKNSASLWFERIGEIDLSMCVRMRFARVDVCTASKENIVLACIIVVPTPRD